MKIQLTEGDKGIGPVCGDASFQLTPSRRATQPVFLPHIRVFHFNSRPHGGRPLVETSLTTMQTFQLTPSRRATLRDVDKLEVQEFQLTPSRRATYFVVLLDDRIVFQLTPSRRATATLPRASTTATFQLTPSRRATLSVSGIIGLFFISTHALTEGDGKFRQIFLLNRGYAYSISLYFLPHFISLLPQILSFQQKSFKFQVRIFLLFSVHLAFALQNQCVHHVKYRFCTNMFYFVFVLFTQIVKPQTIGLFIYDFF